MNKLDSVLTVAIGRAQYDGHVMSERDWTVFRSNILMILSDGDTGGHVVASTLGAAQCADQDGSEETAVFVVVNVADPVVVRKAVADELRLFKQSSACFAFDPFHEPAFGTDDGFRPRLPLTVADIVGS